MDFLDELGVIGIIYYYVVHLLSFIGNRLEGPMNLSCRSPRIGLNQLVNFLEVMRRVYQRNVLMTRSIAAV